MKATHLPIVALLLCCSAASAGPAEHQEFDATLHAPFHAGALAARTFKLTFAYPGLARPANVHWRVDLRAPGGRTVLRWRGQVTLTGDEITVTVPWSGRLGEQPAPDGIYRVRLHALLQHEDAVDQEWEIAVGTPRALATPAFAPLPGAFTTGAAPAPGALPYIVYLGNLHSQTNHSDGGADVANCRSAQRPQSAPYGPADAFAYARGRGLDILVASEHNHLFDGAAGIAPDADPATAKALYRAGLATAATFSLQHPDFLALYGLEWGVIEKGGHINIFNSDELLGWETNASGAPFADTITPRSDYAALYTLMRQRGWVGQFNHPTPSGQFQVGGVPLAYTDDGAAVMVLCEVMNTSAFSDNVTETETRRSSFEGACNRLLEAGYRLAFSTNQDNHCANWGASYGNRTGILLPMGVMLDRASLVAALRARRIFATMDKASQLVLTANGHLMGEQFTNRGPLTLTANFASLAGRRVAAVAIMEGVPGRNDEVTRLSQRAEITITPTPGAHFYYAKVTQDDGNLLWSAPVWIMQAELMY